MKHKHDKDFEDLTVEDPGTEKVPVPMPGQTETAPGVETPTPQEEVPAPVETPESLLGEQLGTMLLARGDAETNTQVRFCLDHLATIRDVLRALPLEGNIDVLKEPETKPE